MPHTHTKLEPDKHVHMPEKFQNENLSAAINLAYQKQQHGRRKATTKPETSAIKRFLSKHLSLEISTPKMGMWVGVLGNWKRNRKEGHLRINQNVRMSQFEPGAMWQEGEVREQTN